jgi:hypothetical protein
MPASLRTRGGNLSIPAIRAAVCGAPPPDGDAERAGLRDLRAAGFDEVEDYVAWAAVEREEGRPDFAHHRANARAARDAGLEWVPFLWAHAAPAWVRAAPDWTPARCLEHGEPGPLPSLFAPGTERLVERWWRTAGAEIGGLAATVAVGFPADYGEVGYGCGMADWLLVPWGEVAHHHVGLWCGGPHGLGGADDAPRAPAELARAYRGRVTAWTEELLALAARAFPGARLEIKLGHGSEALAHGVDWSAVVHAAARAGATVRSTHSGLLPLATRRLASLCRSHGARFATEAPRGIGVGALRRRVLVDLAEGATSWFWFPEQHARVADERARAAAGAGAGIGPAERRVAALYPRRAIERDPGLGTAEALSLAHDALAAVADFAVLEEAQVEAGELEPFAALVVLDPTPDFDPRARLAPWLERGGVLILAHGGAVPRYAGAPAEGEAFFVGPGREEQRLLVGAGWGSRDNAGPAWGLDHPVAGRWTRGRARLLCARPAGASEVGCEVYAPRGARVTLWADGARILSAPLHGPGSLAGPLPPGAGPLVAIELAGEALRDGAAAEGDDRADEHGGATDEHGGAGTGHAAPDRECVDLLVRAILAGPPGAEVVAAPANPRVACEAGGPGVERVGRGLVLRGDGTPLAALAWLRAWLDGRLPVAPPAVDRDPAERDWVARWPDARLVLALAGRPEPERDGAME